MRLIDIYRETASGTALVAAGCIQTGATDLKKSVQSKFYTMSDGTVCCYPVQTAKTGMTLTVECTRDKAAAIADAAAQGSLLFAGLRYAANYTASPTQPFTYGVRAFPTGDVQIAEKYALSNIYAVSIPLILDASGASYRGANVAALIPSALSLGGAADTLTGYEMTLVRSGGNKLPMLARRGCLFTGSSSLAVSLTLGRADYSETRTLTGLTATLGGVAATVTISDSAAIVTGTAALSVGETILDIACSLTGCRTLYVRIPVYRQYTGV